MKKKILALVLVVALVASLAVALVACNPDNGDQITFGLIALHDENSTYDKNFIDAATAVANKMGAKLIIKRNIPESNECYEAAADLVDQGCDVIFADSFGHETYMLRAAKEFPDVVFAHATGTMAHTEKLPNFYNAFASIYEGRYLAGVAAGLKLIELYGEDITPAEAKIGYVGAFPYAEVVSGYTSFYLGVRSVVANATMEVQYTSSWYDEAAEKEAANALIQRGAKLISQHADSMGAPTACKEAGIPNVTYNISTEASCSGSYVIGSKVNWEPYFELLIQHTLGKNVTLDYDYVGHLGENIFDGGSVEVLEIGSAAAAGTKEKLEEVAAKLRSGELNVFDTNNFTVGGEKVTKFTADVDTDNDFTPDTQVIENGIFMESKFRSAPYFTIRIDGITELNN